MNRRDPMVTGMFKLFLSHNSLLDTGLKELPPYGEMKRHRTLGNTQSFCDIFVLGERKTSTRSSSGKFYHRAKPETNQWHPCQRFKTKKKAHSRMPTVPDGFSLASLHTSRTIQVGNGKNPNSAARRKDFIVFRGKETVGVLRSSGLQTASPWNKPSRFPNR